MHQKDGPPLSLGEQLCWGAGKKRSGQVRGALPIIFFVPMGEGSPLRMVSVEQVFDTLSKMKDD